MLGYNHRGLPAEVGQQYQNIGLRQKGDDHIRLKPIEDLPKDFDPSEIGPDFLTQAAGFASDS
jgi:hypothetical protein